MRLMQRKCLPETITIVALLINLMVTLLSILTHLLPALASASDAQSAKTQRLLQAALDWSCTLRSSGFPCLPLPTVVNCFAQIRTFTS